MTVVSDRPASSEYAPYYEHYISLVPPGDVVSILERQMKEFAEALHAVPHDRETYRYAPDKWSIRQVAGHLVDSERVFGFRAAVFARGEEAQLPGFDENAYVKHANFDDIALVDLVDELGNLRRANIALFRHLSPKAWQREGVANKNRISVRALAFVIAGHAQHHLNVLRERYFGHEKK